MVGLKYHKGNFAFMLTGLVLVVFAVSMSEQFGGPLVRILMPITVVIGLAISLFSISPKSNLFRLGISLILTDFFLALVNMKAGSFVIGLVELFILLSLYVGMVVISLNRVLFSGKVDNNKIIGAICIYLLFGMIWAMLYSLLLEMGLASFNNLDGSDWASRLSNLIYFSYVTLSTLGYGDITPVTPVLRFLVYMEALVGQFYLAILVASLIGAKFSNSSDN